MPTTVSRRYNNYPSRSGSLRQYINLARTTVKAARYARKAYDSHSKKTYAKPKAPERKARSKKAYQNRKRFTIPAKTVQCVKSCQKQIRNLQKFVATDRGTHIYRDRFTGRSIVAANRSNHTLVIANTNALMESAGANMRYFDAAVPLIPDEADVSEGTYPHKMLYKNVYNNITCANNYHVPVHCTIYQCTPKVDTNKTPLLAFTQGLADKSLASSDSALVYLTDSEIFKSIWKIHKKVTKRLEPGTQISCTFSKNNVSYSSNLVDDHSDTYQKRHAACVYMIRTEGVLGHDTVVHEQGRLRGGVDYEINRKWVIEYDAGRAIQTIVAVDISNDFTNTGVVSNQPIVDNQSYGVG